MTNYFMATDDLDRLTLECGETLDLIASLSAGKLMELRTLHKEDPEALSRAMLEFVIKGWSFKDGQGDPKPLTIEHVYDLKLAMFLDLLSKVMEQYDIPFDKPTSNTAQS